MWPTLEYLLLTLTLEIVQKPLLMPSKVIEYVNQTMLHVQTTNMGMAHTVQEPLEEIATVLRRVLSCTE